MCSFSLCSMRSLATVTMTTKKGHTSTWHFAQCSTGWFAFGGCHRPLVKKVNGIKELRALYHNYLSYGYTPVGDVDPAFILRMNIADPWESELPLADQLALDALALAK